MTTPTPKSRSADLPGHINVRRRKEWALLLKRIGFKVTIVTYKYTIPVAPHIAS